MPRAILCVLDSFGIGGAPDAADFGDEGANTLGHIAEKCAAGEADKEGLRQGPLFLPNMDMLGLGLAAKAAAGSVPPDLSEEHKAGVWAHAKEVSKGKDTPSGHWEIAGVPVSFDWGYFPETEPCFPPDLIEKFIVEAKLPGILGNKHASGTTIIADLGEEHIKTGKPICYTSADSVFQIAAHEQHFGLDRLYEICEIARKLLDPLNIGRVIARPFIGETPGDFQRTGNRRDFSVLPPEPTLLDRAKEAGRKVLAVGKISDIYAAQGVTHKIKASGNMALFDATLDAMDMAEDGDLIFTNFVDFDMEYGHRRDVPGYAAALEKFDRRLPELVAKMRQDDVLILTADHGCDPTWKGSDHTREQVPVLCFSPIVQKASAGGRETFADIGESVASWLKLPAGPHGKSFL
ncbi:phosphopentomutase [Maritalea mediterranea]|uniref:Phosphopentomutase n=1 Tax=Maritalea mediterranea TaxID=2909667 RepID=A0ABS9E5B8_9HYPH|nr:phosphopentomutase [Maritalea mediterranea]MCF4097464.1 phosphopentomutase [Maritalea mediterranea]